MKQQKDILLAFYGDDFTGSTDALEFISNAGAKAILFIEAPTPEQLSLYPHLDVIGVAGATRSLPPRAMNKELAHAFEQLKTTGAKHVHYKVCSTFDSSPVIGSIGQAMDTAQAVFGNNVIPVLGGTPALGRHCVFGNLFAKMGIGSKGSVYRLDRHPSMKDHPVTPANESDLIVHLEKQTDQKGRLVDIIQQQKPIKEWTSDHDASNGFVLLDAMHEEDLLRIGEWLDSVASTNAPLFSIGSSGIEMALGKYWNKSGKLTASQQWDDPGTADPLLVISGSCSPVTGKQISYAAKAGFHIVELDARMIADTEGTDLHAINVEVIEKLRQKRHVLVHTGPRQANNLSSQKLGTALGLIAKDAAEATEIKRVIIAGGDTSSYAARAMEIDAVSMTAPLVSGAPLCRAYSANKYINGLQVNFKGGQVGTEDYFETCIRGKK